MDTASTLAYALSLHDALPIFEIGAAQRAVVRLAPGACVRQGRPGACVFAFDVVHSHLRCSSVGHRTRRRRDRKSTRLNSSHVEISYAVFCWKKKNQRKSQTPV